MLQNVKKVVRLDAFFRITEALELTPSELMKLVEEEATKNYLG